LARILIKKGQAKCIRRTPFTIKLLKDTTNYTQPIVLGVDTGSKTIGVSAVISNTSKVVYLSEVVIRNDISEKMDRRRSYRRNRRNRKTRYRKPRFLNRGNSKRLGRISPTITSKINSHLKEINFVKSILPITKVILETASFDTVALANPNIKLTAKVYQKGLNYQLGNTKAYVLGRDGHTCRNCKANKVGTRLEVHHIIYRSNGGSDLEKNLITLCKPCHDGVHAGTTKLKVSKGHISKLKHATHMNSIRIQLLKSLPKVEETFGYITKENRQNLGLPKKHYMDAVVIASEGKPIKFKEVKVLYKRHIAKGSYQLYKGKRSEQNLPTGKICGYKRYDKVKYLGKEYFIQSRMSTGYAILSLIDNVNIKLKPMAKFSKMRRLLRSGTCMISY
jgi:hypothetical protein